MLESKNHVQWKSKLNSSEMFNLNNNALCFVTDNLRNSRGVVQGVVFPQHMILNEILGSISQKQSMRCLEGRNNVVCNSKIKLNVHRTHALLSAASLLTNFIRNWHVRNFESNSESGNRKIMTICDPKSPIWKCQIQQTFRKKLFSDILSSLETEKSMLELGRKYGLATSTENEKYISSLRYVTGLMEDNRAFSMYPVPSHSQSETPALKGLSVRLAGPRRGNRAVVFKKAIGSSSTNSVGLVVYDEAKAQVPGKMGTYGLCIKIVYGSTSRQPSTLTTFWDGHRNYSPFNKLQRVL